MLRKIRNTLQELGFAGTLFYLVNRVSEKLTRRRLFFDYLIVAQPIGTVRQRRHNPYRVQVFDSEESVDLLARQFPTPVPVLRSRFRQGAVCIALDKAGEYVGCAWLALNGYMEDEVRCMFRPIPERTTGWDFDVYVVPAMRGTMAFMRIWEAATAYYGEHGRRWSLSRISNFNQSSLQAHRSLGAEVLARAVFFVVGPFQLMMASCRPWLHFGWSRSQYPTIRPEVNP